MKNKFALCFRPVGIETEEADDDHKKQVKHHSTSIIVAKEHRRKMISPVIHHHPQSSRKILSRVLKAILLQPSPPLRFCNGNIQEVTFVPKDNNWGKNNNQSIKIVSSISSLNSSSSSSTNSTTASTSTSTTARASFSSHESKELKALSLKRSLARSRSNSLDRKKKAKTTSTNIDKTPKSSSSSCEDLVFYLIVLALLATIFWGKLYAILVTSMWLYFVPHRLLRKPGKCREVTGDGDVKGAQEESHNGRIA